MNFPVLCFNRCSITIQFTVRGSIFFYHAENAVGAAVSYVNVDAVFQQRKVAIVLK